MEKRSLLVVSVCIASLLHQGPVWGMESDTTPLLEKEDTNNTELFFVPEKTKACVLPKKVQKVKHHKETSALYKKRVGEVSDLASMYKHGEGVTQDYAKALELNEMAREMGDASAVNNLGCMYQHGEGIDKDIAKALELYQEAEEMGSAYAVFNQACIYESGEGVDKDDAKACALVKKAAEMGHVLAMLQLGSRYLKGNGVKQNPVLASYFFENAAMRGNVRGKYYVGLAYKNGYGVSRCMNTAYCSFEAAAQGGDSDAMNELGDIHWDRKNYKKARGYYKEAVKKGNTSRLERLEQMYSDGFVESSCICL